MCAFNRVLAEAYRCPEELCSFALDVEKLSNAGFFHLGADTIGYGRYSWGAKFPDGTMPEILSEVRIDDGELTLPFDPNEIISNLRLERYVDQSRSSASELIYRAYYLLRPLLPVPVRRHLQRVRLKASRAKVFPSWPLDWTSDRFLSKLLGLSLKAKGKRSTPFISFWPEGVPSCVIMTHDVETETGLKFCSELMDIDESFGVKSSFQLVPEGRYEVTNAVINGMRQRGFEVNVHDFNHDGHLYSDRQQFLRRAAAINEYGRKFGAAGFRAGAMYRNLDWYDSLEFKYDMSVPTVGHLEAQGGGCCTLRPYFIKGLVELPLTTTQDYSLFHILGDYSIDLWKKQIHTIIENRGLISFIVHPDYIIDKKAQAVYKSLLSYISQLRDEGKISVALPGDVAAWWTKRNAMRLEEFDGGWRAVGSGSEVAHVGRATLDEHDEIVLNLQADCISQQAE